MAEIQTNIYEEINKSETDKSIKTELDSELKKANNILKDIRIKYGHNSENFRVFYDEYKEAREKILLAMQNDRKIIIEELGDIKKELNDVQIIKDNMKNAKNIIKKDFKNMGANDAMITLKYLQKHFNEYNDSKSSGKIEDIKDLKSKEDVIRFQDELLKKMFPNGKGFSGKYIIGKNGEIGNYIQDIKSFEIELKTKKLSDINSVALSNYFDYLDFTNQIRPDLFQKKFTNDFMKQLAERLGTDSNGSNLKKILENKGVLQEVKKSIKIEKKDAENIYNALNSNIDSISKLDIKYLINNPEYISKIIDREKVEKIIKELGKNPTSNKLELRNINPSLQKYFYLNPIVSINDTNINMISKEDLIKDYNKIIEKFIKNKDGKYDITFLIKTFIEIGIDKDFIKKVINKLEKRKIYEGSYKEVIKIELGEVKESLSKSYNSIKEKYHNFDDKGSLDKIIKSKKESDIKDLNIITNYIIQNIGNKDVLKDFEKMINNDFYGENGSFLFIINKNIEVSKILINRNLGYIAYLPKDILSNKDIINTYLNATYNEKTLSNDINSKIQFLQYLDLSDINNMLMVYEYFLDRLKGEDIENQDSNIMGIFLLNPLIQGKLLSRVKEAEKNGTEVNSEHYESFERIKKLIDRTKGFLDITSILDFQNEVREYNSKNSDLKDEEKDKKSENTIKRLNEKFKEEGIKNSEKVINLIKKSIAKGKLKNEYNNNALYARIINTYPSEESTKIIKAIIETLKEENSKEIKKIAKKIDGNKLENDITQKNDEGKNIIDEEKLKDKFLLFSSKYKQKLKNEGKDIKNSELLKNEIRKEFLKDIKGDKLNEEDKKNLGKLIERIEIDNDYGLKISNIEEFKTYLISGSKSNFQDYAEEKGIKLKDPLSEKQNSHLTQTPNYNYDLEKDPDTIYITNKDGTNRNITLSEYDKKLVNNETALNNIVNFNQVLQDLGLIELWEHKDKIFNVIGGAGFDAKDGNFLDKGEIQKFLNYILKSLGKSEIKDGNFEAFENIFINQNKSELTGDKDINKKGNNTFMENFRQKFIDKGIFIASEFEKSLK